MEIEVKKVKLSSIKGYKNNRRNITSKHKEQSGAFGGRPNAVFEYVGETMDKKRLIK